MVRDISTTIDLVERGASSSCFSDNSKLDKSPLFPKV
jgi:hypothetical protein